MSNPLVTIITAAFNASDFIDNAIDSVLLQTHSNWELLVINDGSTDKTEAIVNARRDPRIRYFSQPNRGVSAARNVGLRKMSGEYFCFLDADDVLTPHSLSARLKCFTSGEICFADGCVDIYDADMKGRIGGWNPRPAKHHFNSLVRLDGRCFFGPTWMIRNKAGITYRFDEELTHGEELFFYLSYAHVGEYAYTDEVVLKYRRSAHSAMGNLRGLATGYTLIKQKMKVLTIRPGFLDRIVFAARSRKIVFLSFLKARQLKAALKYVIIGNI